MKGKAKLFISLAALAFILTVLALDNGLRVPAPVLDKLPQLETVFLSIIIQALPFVLIGVFGSALMQNLVTVETVEKKLAQTGKLRGILLAIGAGFFFPVCDCGVIPVARRLLYKKVPPYMAVAFLVTAPLVNPVTVWATATAFGYSLPVTLIRVAMAIVVGVAVAILVSEFLPAAGDLLNQRGLQEYEAAASAEAAAAHLGDGETAPGGTPIRHPRHKDHSLLAGIFDHATVEFLEVGKFLIVGALIAATIQTFIPKQLIVGITQNPLLSVAVMMLLALCLSLCAEADAFVARSFTYHFPLGSVMSFMVFGQMLDIKNAALLLKSFKLRAVLIIFGSCAVLVFLFSALLNLCAADPSFWGRLLR